MHKPAVGGQPWHLPGTNLTLGEALRLLLLLCGPPWLFAVFIILTRLAVPPATALEWILYVAAGPAAWGAFISAVADGRTLLGRPREPDTPRQPWWQVIHIDDHSTRSEVVYGDRIKGKDVATHGSAMAKNHSVAVVGDGNTIVMEPPTDPTPLREAYLNRVLEQTRTLQLTAVDRKAAQDPTADTGLALAAVYTALMTQQPEQAMPSMPKRLEDREPQRLSAVAMLNREGKLALLGDPGSGKSTFVNFVALCLAGEGLDRPDANLALLTTPLPVEKEDREQKSKRQPWRHKDLLPVRVVLRDFAARSLPPAGQPASGDHLWGFIAAELGVTLGDYAPHLKAELQEKGGLILLDGLDEVPEAEDRRGQVKQAVMGFAADFPRCRFVVTSRTYAYQKQDWKLPSFAEAVLAPFGWGQIAAFVDHWYAHLAAVRGQNPEDAQGAPRCSRPPSSAATGCKRWPSGRCC